MAGELLADVPIHAAFVGSEMRVLGDRVDDDWPQRDGGHFWSMEAACPAAALDQRHYGFLWRRRAIGAVLRLAACKCFIALDELAFAAKRLWIDLPHCLANAMRHKPRGLVGDAKGPMQLMRREAFLARRH